MGTNIKLTFSLFLLITISGCGLFCDKEGVTFKLSEIETSLVPFTVEQELIYVDGSADYVANVLDINLTEVEIDRNTACNVNSTEVLSYNIVISR